jgi:hypothetical protein
LTRISLNIRVPGEELEVLIREQFSMIPPSAICPDQGSYYGVRTVHLSYEWYLADGMVVETPMKEPEDG